MSDFKVRSLNAEEVEVRVSRATENGVLLVPFADARVFIDIMNDAFGIGGWTSDCVRDERGVLFGIVSIWNPEVKQWVSHKDCGVESNAAKEKGESSDAFKRACVRFGVCRELYNCPILWMGQNELGGRLKIYEKGKDKNGKPIFACGNHFQVTAVNIDDRSIKGISIKIVELNEILTFGDLRKKKQKERADVTSVLTSEETEYVELPDGVKPTPETPKIPVSDTTVRSERSPKEVSHVEAIPDQKDYDPNEELKKHMSVIFPFASYKGLRIGDVAMEGTENSAKAIRYAANEYQGPNEELRMAARFLLERAASICPGNPDSSLPEACALC